MKIINKILIPTDFSSFSLAALEYVASLAVLYDARIYLLHVVPEDVLVAPYPNVDLNSETIFRDTTEKAQEQMQHFVSDHFKHLHNINQVMRCGEPSNEIVKFVKEEGIDLIVMATHGRTGLAHMLMGSVAEKVVRRSTVPVLTVKPESMWNNFLDLKDVEEQLHMES